MLTRLIHLITTLLLAFPFQATAGEQWQDLEKIRAGVIQFVSRQTEPQSGSVSVTAEPLDPRLRMPVCPGMEYFVPSGSRLWGNSNVGVRCSSPSPWTVYVPVNIRITAEIVFAARPLPSGHKISEADILLKSDDLTQYPTGVITDPKQALGKIVGFSVAPGYPLRPDMLKAPHVIVQGQSVKIVAQGRGFQVNAEGKALTSAAAGQIVSVRTPSGQIIKGTAKEGGIVEVPF